MPKIELNAKKLEALKPESRRIQIFDAGQPGLTVRIAPDGVKSFSVVYRFQGRWRRFTIGKYPAVSLADARSRTREALREVERGEDPMAKKVAIRESGTFKELADLYMEEHSKAKKSSWAEDQRMFDAYLLPGLKSTKASAVTIDEIEILLEDLAKRAPVQANRVRALLRHLYAWALSSRSRRRSFSLTMNPCQYVPRLANESPRERVYSDEELKALWAAFETIGVIGELFKLQLLTGARKGELSKMEWSEVDLKDAIWTQPGKKTKNGKAHVVPLSSEAVRILSGLEKRQTKLKNPSKRESDFVFCSSRTGTSAITWLQKAADRARIESKVDDFHAHDLRRTCATRLAKAGVPDAVLKMILNHSLGKDITGVYNQYKYFEERQQALDAWARRLLVMVSDLKAAV